jgi:hypothetical protein
MIVQQQKDSSERANKIRCTDAMMRRKQKAIVLMRMTEIWAVMMMMLMMMWLVTVFPIMMPGSSSSFELGTPSERWRLPSRIAEIHELWRASVILSISENSRVAVVGTCLLGLPVL